MNLGAAATTTLSADIQAFANLEAPKANSIDEMRRGGRIWGSVARALCSWGYISVGSPPLNLPMFSFFFSDINHIILLSH